MCIAVPGEITGDYLQYFLWGEGMYNTSMTTESNKKPNKRKVSNLKQKKRPSHMWSQWKFMQHIPNIFLKIIVLFWLQIQITEAFRHLTDLVLNTTLEKP